MNGGGRVAADDFLAVQVGNESIVVTKPEHERFEACGVGDIERHPQIGGGVLIAHLGFEVGSDELSQAFSTTTASHRH